MDGSETAGLTFQQETYDQIIDDIRPLLTKHWHEIARNKDRVPFDPDYRVYTALGHIKQLRIYTARLNSGLCGYAIYVVKPHPHYKSTLWAVSDIFWLDPAARGRGLGDGLFDFLEQALADEGVMIMHTTSKAAHPAARAFLESRNHKLIEFGHEKVLGHGG